MNSDIWMHCIVFITVFFLVGILMSRRRRKKDRQREEYKEIEAEVFETGELVRQAELDRREASEARKEAEELKRKAAEEWEKARHKGNQS